jgi:3-phenylpropionate/trans-cinnamate dioxygenase ferredoxin reductase subunit
MQSDNVIIIGAGQAGGQAAISLRSSGFEGRIILIGDEPYVPYERPPLSKAMLAGELPIERSYLRKPEFYPEKNIELWLKQHVKAIDRAAKTITLADGETLPYAKLIIATGSRVRKLSLPGADKKGIYYVRTIADTLAIQNHLKEGARLVLIGAGYIGLEVAAVGIKKGCKVTVLEALDRVMARVVAPEVSVFYEDVHKAAGVDIRKGVRIAEITGNDHVKAVKLEDGSEVPADLVVAGVGVVPEIALAEAAGLKIDNGIVVDEFCQTSDPDIYAVGDVTNHPNAILGQRLRLESVQNAMSQGLAAAQAICGKPQAYAEVPWFWSDQYDLKLQIAGLWEPTDNVVIRGNMAEGKFSVFYLRNGAVVAVNAINNMKDFLPAKKLIAAHVVVDPLRLADGEVSVKELVP